MGHNILKGAVTAIVGAFPAAGLVALVYCFPIPLDDTRHSGCGLFGIILAMFAVVFYGILGGFVILGFLGALAGVAAQALCGGDTAKVNRFRTFLALAASLVCMIFLAVLDLLIGPW